MERSFSMDQIEIWTKILEVPGYSISNYGRVKNDKFDKLLKPSIDKNSYYRYGLYTGTKVINRVAHRLVAIHFIPNFENKEQVNHIDGNKQNNHMSNLEWVTNQENITHAWRNNLMSPRPGIKHHNCKLTEQDVFEIIELVKNGTPRKIISEIYNIAKGQVTRITTGKRWSSLTKIGVK